MPAFYIIVVGGSRNWRGRWFWIGNIAEIGKLENSIVPRNDFTFSPSLRLSSDLI